MTELTIFVWLFSVAFGFSYLIYGKKRDRKVMMLSGALLCVYPYFVSNTILLVAIGAIFILLPLFVRQ